MCLYSLLESITSLKAFLLKISSVHTWNISCIAVQNNCVIISSDQQWATWFGGTLLRKLLMGTLLFMWFAILVQFVRIILHFWGLKSYFGFMEPTHLKVLGLFSKPKQHWTRVHFLHAASTTFCHGKLFVKSNSITKALLD